MPTDVQEKTITACAKAVHEASQQIWAEAEAAAGHDAAERLKSLNHPPEAQAHAHAEAQRAAVAERGPLVWEVFDRPGRWRGRWQLAPAFPDGRLAAAERERALREGNLVVTPLDTEQDIAHHLASLRHHSPERV